MAAGRGERAAGLQAEGEQPPGVGQGSLTGGSRSGLTGDRPNRSGPILVRTGTEPAQIQNSNLNSKNEIFLKISKNTSKCDEFNGVKFSQKFIHLV